MILLSLAVTLCSLRGASTGNQCIGRNCVLTPIAEQDNASIQMTTAQSNPALIIRAFVLVLLAFSLNYAISKFYWANLSDLSHLGSSFLLLDLRPELCHI